MKKERLSTRDIRSRSDRELETLQRQLAEDLFRHRLKLSTSQEDDTSVLRETKKEMARVKTILRARQLRIEEPVGGEEAEA